MIIEGMHYNPSCNCMGCRMMNGSKRKIGKAIDVKNNLYLESLNFDFDEMSCVSDRYKFQKAINNIFEKIKLKSWKDI